VEEYFRQPYRGYGRNVISVFEALKEDNCRNAFRPAEKQFDGLGSHGNGGAMRISPAALFSARQQPEAVDVILTVASCKCSVIVIIIFVPNLEKYVFKNCTFSRDVVLVETSRFRDGLETY